MQHSKALIVHDAKHIIADAQNLGRRRNQRSRKSARGSNNAGAQTHLQAPRNHICHPIRTSDHLRFSKAERTQAQNMLNPFLGTGARIRDAGIASPTTLYTQEGKGTIQSPATSAEVLVLTATDIGHLSAGTSAVRTVTLATTGTGGLMADPPNSAFLKSASVPAPNQIIENRPNYAGMKLLYDGPVDTAQGECAFGHIPRSMFGANVSYDELINNPLIRVVSVQEILRNEIIIPFIKISSIANTFTTTAIPATDVLTPIACFTGLQPGITIRVAYVERGECYLDFRNPGYASQDVGHREDSEAYLAINEAISISRPFFAKPYSAPNDPNWILTALGEAGKSMYDSVGGAAGVVSGIKLLRQLR